MGWQILLIGLGSAVAQQPTATIAVSIDSVSVGIRALLEGGEHKELTWPDFGAYQAELQGLYSAGGYAPLWLEKEHPSESACEAIGVLLGAAEEGLDPETYDASLLRERWHLLAVGPRNSPEEAALFDVALSVELLRYVHDVHLGRVNPKNLSFGLDVKPKEIDLVALIQSALAQKRIAAMAEEAEPRMMQYQLIKQALKRYRGLAQDPTLRPVPQVEGKISPGDPFEGVPELRHFLIALGDLEAPAADAPKEVESGLYEGALVEGVKSFQVRHGLEVDGILGRATIELINQPISHRVQQLELALERLRWLPEAEDGPYISVNVPSFRLMAFDAQSDLGTRALRMKVIVGGALQKQTPMFAQKMTYIVFRPYWNVPHSIAVKELVPKIRKNSRYMDAEDLEIVSGRGGDGARPVGATQANLDAVVAGTMRLRQRPGPSNSLGLVKFIFPNATNIYLHGTPSQSLFQRRTRAISHGCVRVEDPVALAEWLLKDQGWTREMVEAAMDGEKPRKVNLEKPIPVFILYTTAMVDPLGRVFFLDDVYGFDTLLKQALALAYESFLL